jgi:hypothetical protein
MRAQGHLAALRMDDCHDRRVRLQGNGLRVNASFFVLKPFKPTHSMA